MLSACANKLSRLKEQAEEYAALIMEELDPERFGYIEVGQLSLTLSIFYIIGYGDVSTFIYLVFMLCYCGLPKIVHGCVVAIN